MKTVKLLTAAFVCVFFYFVVTNTNLDLVRASLRQVGCNFLYLLTVTFAANGFATAGWKYCLGAQGRHLSTAYLFLVRQIGEAIGLVNPAGVVGGEAVKLFLLSDRLPQTATITASLVISRAMMVVTQLALFIAVAVIVAANTPLHRFSLPANSAYGLSYAAILAGVAALLFWLGWKLVRQHRAGMVWVTKVHAELSHVRQELARFFKFDTKRLALAGLCFTLHWALGGVEIYLILHFLQVPVGMLQAVLTDLGVMFFKAAGAFIPGQLGAEELGNRVMLGVAGPKAAGVWLTLSVLRRSRQLFWILFGVLAYLAGNRLGWFPPLFHGNTVRKS